MCRGLYYRVVIQSFVTARGVIRFTRELRPLKKKSCPGCDNCAELPERFTGLETVLIGVPNGALMRLCRAGEGHPGVEVIG